MIIDTRPVKLLIQNTWKFALPIAIAAVVSLIALNELGYQRSVRSAEVMESLQQRRSELENLMQATLDAETGQRGFLLTGDQKYLVSYQKAVAEIGPTLDKLRTLYVRDPVQLQQFAELSRNVSKKLAELEVTTRLRELGGSAEAWMNVVRTDVGLNYMEAVRKSGDALASTAIKGIGSTRAQIDQSLSISRFGITLAALSALLVFHLYLRQAKKLNAAAETQRLLLAEERDRLGELVRERTLRLSELARHLQIVQEQERDRLARELHDELGALLTAAKFDVARIKTKLPPDNAELLDRVAHLNESLNAGILLKRRIVEDLRPSSLSNLGLQAALEILASEFSERSGIEVKTDLEAVELGAEADLTVYRTVQESLTNVAKYASAKQVTISLHNHTHFIEVSIADDGSGFDVNARKSASHGLPGMRHRIEALNGTFSVSSVIGQGARVHAVFPKPKIAITPEQLS